MYVVPAQPKANDSKPVPGPSPREPPSPLAATHHTLRFTPPGVVGAVQPTRNVATPLTAFLGAVCVMPPDAGCVPCPASDVSVPTSACMNRPAQPSGVVMFTESVTICPGVIVAGLDVIVTVGATPPEWQPLQPCEAMPFLWASADGATSHAASPTASASPWEPLKTD